MLVIPPFDERVSARYNLAIGFKAKSGVPSEEVWTGLAVG